MKRAMDGAPNSRLQSSISLAIAALGLMGPPAYAGLQIRSFETHTHVVIPIDPKITYSVEKVQKDGKLLGIRLMLNNVTSPEDSEGVLKVSDPRTSAVRVSRVRGDDGLTLIYDFAMTGQAQASGIEYFDYRSKNNNEIQLDYWLGSQKPDPVAAQAPAVAKPVAVKKPAPVKPVAKVAAKKVIDKTDADSDFVGCGQPIRRNTDAFVNFKIWHRPFDYREFFKLELAHTRYEYPSVKPKKGEDFGTRAKEVAHYRLAHKVYGQQQYALVLRTIEFFEKTYPQSPLLEEIEFLKANTLVELSKLLRTDRFKLQAYELFREIMIKAPDSARARNIHMYLTQEFMTEGQHARAVEYALQGAEAIKEGKDPMYWGYKLAAAEAMFAMGEHERAEQQYQAIMQSDSPLKDEAAFKLGEVFASRKFFERATIAFETAIRKNPKAIQKFPTAIFNLAESYYRQDKYADADKNFKEFLRLYPNETYSWAAGYRIAELAQLQLKNADASKHQVIETQYESVVNRFPYTPAEGLSLARLGSCSRSSDQNTKTLFYQSYFANRDLKQMESPILDPLEVESLMDLGEARFYYQGKDYAGTLGRVNTYREKYARLPIGAAFKTMLQTSAVEHVIELSKAGKYKQSLKAAVDYEDILPIPTPYGFNLALTRATYELGRLDETLVKLQALEKVLDQASLDDKDEFHFIKGRILRLTGSKPEAVVAEIQLIRDEVGGKPGPLSANKLDELAQLALAANAGKGDVKAALSYDAKSIREDIYKKLPLEKQIAVWLRYVDCLIRTGENQEAIKYSERALLLFGMHTQFKDKDLLRMKEFRAQALYDSGDDKKAVQALAELIEQAPKHRRRMEFEFERAKSLARLGRETEALNAFEKLAKSSEDSVWKKSAQAELDQVQWENNITNQDDRRSK